MAITYEGGSAVTFDGMGSADSEAISWPAGHAVDDIAVVFAVQNDNNGALETNSTGWTEEEIGSTASGRDRHWGLWWKRATGTSEADFVLENSTTTSSQPGAIVVLLFRGIDTTTALDVAHVGAIIGNNDPTQANDPITTVTDNAAVLLLLGSTHDGITAIGTPPTGFTHGVTTITRSDGQIMTAYDLDVGAAGTVTPGTWGLTHGGNSNADQTLFTVAFRPAEGGATGEVITPDGGAIAGGSTPVVVGLLVAPAGGARSGGVAVMSVGLGIDPQGGAVAGGTATTTAGIQIPAVGGARAGGEGALAVGLQLSTSGGARAGGGAPVGIGLQVIPSGGAIAGGTAVISSGGDTGIDPDGGAVAGGAAPITVGLQIAPTGGIIAGGAAATVSGLRVFPSGGGRAGGSAVFAVGVSITPQGGAIAGGSASIVSGSVGGTVISPAGGAVAGGTTPIGRGVSVNPAGGARSGGTGEIASGLSIVAGGGARSGGSAEITVGLSIAAAGGARAGGTASIQTGATGTVITPSGGGRAGGASVFGRRLPLPISDRVVFFGIADEVVRFETSAAVVDFANV